MKWKAVLTLSGIGSTKKKTNFHNLRKPRCVYPNLGGEIRQPELPLPPAHLNNVILDAFVVTIKLFPLAHSCLGSSSLTVYMKNFPL